MKMGHSLPPPVFIAGALGLDVVNSLARPAGKVIDWWGDGEQLLNWMKQARLLTDSDIAIATSNFSKGELDRTAARARELREWFRRFVKAHKGKSLKKHALARLSSLNKILERDEVFWSLERVPASSTDRASANGFRLRRQRRWRKCDSLLAPIAQTIAEFICSADFRQVKACQGRNCILFFVDQTRRHGRRWCSMAVCGNRAKQNAHLARRRKRNRTAK